MPNCTWKNQSNGPNEYINTLGVNIGNKEEDLNTNWESLIGKIKAVSRMWYYHNMTLYGKVMIVNALIGSLFVYKLQILHDIPANIIAQTETVINDFIWNGKMPKIPLKTLQINKDHGGLCLISLQFKQNALLCKWPVFCHNNRKIRNLARAFLGELVNENYIWKLNLSIKDSETIFNGKTFWHHTCNLWHQACHYDSGNVTNVKKQNLWYKSHIKIGSKPFMFKEFYRNGVLFVKDIVTATGSFISYEELVRKFSVNCTWLEYCTLIAAIPKRWKELLKLPKSTDGHLVQYDLLSQNSSCSRLIYKQLSTTEVTLKKCAKVWNKKLNHEDTGEDFIHHFKKTSNFDYCITKYSVMMYWCTGKRLTLPSAT